ncbi:hypothetical protein PENNAL_c0237G06214, partial [Penicillium nalgiovense]
AAEAPLALVKAGGAPTTPSKSTRKRAAINTPVSKDKGGVKKKRAAIDAPGGKDKG